ncbi:MAG: CoA transferase [Deltaproteobacteria bacterium]|nr:CoA transferase [Deltaproteobacteria bacterium]
MRGMLDGVRVIDFTIAVAGPGCSYFLADMGAEVIKVEKPGLGDDARIWPPYKNGVSASFVTLNHGKRGVIIDMKKPEGVALFKELVTVSDVLVENFTPGTMADFGVDYPVLKKINPKLVMASISGYGQTGPLSRLAGYDAVLQARAGLMSTTGYPDRPPLRAGTLIVDITTAVTAAFGICAALFARERTGEGEYLDIAMYDVGINLLESKFVQYTVTGEIPTRTGNRFPMITPFDIYKTKDSYVYIICAGDGPFQKLCEGMGMPELTRDPRFNNLFVRNDNEPALKEVIEGWTSLYTTDEVLEKLLATGTPAGPVNDVKQVIEHPHTKARGMLVDIEQPGAGTITTFGPAVKAANSRNEIRGPAPAHGQDNLWLLKEVLGRSDAQAQSVLDSGVMGKV